MDDTTDEVDETVTVSATVSGGNGVAAPSSVTLTIRDDDAAPGVTLSLSPSSISENGGESTVTAKLSHPSSAATTVTVTAAAVTGFYTVGSDTTIVIAAGETANASDTATVAAVDDDVHQGTAGSFDDGDGHGRERPGRRQFGDRDGDRGDADADGRRGAADGGAGAVARIDLGDGRRWRR